MVYIHDKYSNTEEVIAAKRLFDTCGVKYRNLSEENQITLTLKTK